jgi:hypothetical protein
LRHRVCCAVSLLLRQVGDNMRFRVKLILDGVEFQMLISASSKKEALKSMIDTANNYPNKRMQIVSIEPESRDLSQSTR